MLYLSQNPPFREHRPTRNNSTKKAETTVVADAVTELTANFLPQISTYVTYTVQLLYKNYQKCKLSCFWHGILYVIT